MATQQPPSGRPFKASDAETQLLNFSASDGCLHNFYALHGGDLVRATCPIGLGTSACSLLHEGWNDIRRGAVRISLLSTSKKFRL
jgi:hypothetical protein